MARMTPIMVMKDLSRRRLRPAMLTPSATRQGTGVCSGIFVRLTLAETRAIVLAL